MEHWFHTHRGYAVIIYEWQRIKTKKMKFGKPEVIVQCNSYLVPQGYSVVSLATST
jgi:hypothetical protein